MIRSSIVILMMLVLVACATTAVQRVNVMPKYPMSAAKKVDLELSR